MVRAQDQARWVPVGGRPALADKRVLVLGYGSIGRAVARRLTGFEVSLTAVASPGPRRGRPGAAGCTASTSCPTCCPQHDVVVVIVPLSEATAGLVDAGLPGRDARRRPAGQRGPRQGRRHRRPGRGDAATGRIMAALDVTDPEPLPDGHPLWRARGCSSPPTSVATRARSRPGRSRLVREQLTALVAGEPLRNVVNGG